MDKASDHLIKILRNYLNKEKYNVDKDDFQLQLLSNQSFPSIKSITDTLDYFGIENIAATVPKNALNQLPYFFLAVLRENSSTTIAQVTRTKKGIKLFKDNGTREKLTAEEFSELWDGTIVAIENKNTEKNQFTLSIGNPLIPIYLLAIAAISFSAINPELTALIYAFLAALGCGLSYYIVQEDLGIYSETTSEICNSATTNTSCSDVVNSKSAKLFRVISLSDVCVTFFVSVLIILSFIGYHKTFFFGFSIASIPIIVYSIYTQAFLVKKWCPLCLGMAGVLVGLAITSFQSLQSLDALTFDTSYFSKGLVIFGSVYLSWLYFKSLIKKAIELQQVKTAYLKFKRNEDLFSTLLTKNSLPDIIELDQSSRIIFGNPQAELTINAVTNPMCGYCTNSFLTYDKLLETHGEHFKLNIIFNISVDSMDHPGYQISGKIIELYQDNPVKAYEALKDWFNNKDIKRWQSKYGLSSEDSSRETLKQHRDWCEINGVPYTPTTIIENYLFPKEYDIEDLALFIDDLIKNKNKILKIQEAGVI